MLHIVKVIAYRNAAGRVIEYRGQCQSCTWSVSIPVSAPSRFDVRDVQTSAQEHVTERTVMHAAQETLAEDIPPVPPCPLFATEVRTGMITKDGIVRSVRIENGDVHVLLHGIISNLTLKPEDVVFVYGRIENFA